MKSRLVILTMLVLGMLLSTDRRRPGGLRPVSGDNASIAPVRQRRRHGGGGGVLGDQDSGAGSARPAEQRRRRHRAGEAHRRPQPGPAGRGGRRQLGSLPFTGFAAIPVLLGGIALLSAGLVLRRRTGDER